MGNQDATTQKESPLALLTRISQDENLPWQMRLDAAKSLLPYTAKKTPTTLETFNRNFDASNEALKALTDDELRDLIRLATKVTQSRGDAE